MRLGLRQGGRAVAVAAFVLMGTTAAIAADPCAAGAGPDAGNASIVLAPTQGRPVFVEPGAAFRAAVQFGRQPESVRFELLAGTAPRHRHPLAARAISDEGDAASRRFELTVPDGCPEQTYDLKISTASEVLTARHAVAVARLGRRIRLVHLSNMNIGDVGAPDFDRRLIDEVNLMAPTLIVATGDLLDSAHDDPAQGWQALSDFLAAFHAPVLVACGDHDDLGLYSRHMAPSPIGAIKLGRYEGLVLHDLPGRPIDADAEQIRWVERRLGQGGAALRFIISHDERPNLLAHWQRQGTLAPMLLASRVGLWFVGGHRDWDGREFGALVADADPLLYLRTHQSSRALREGASGVSHYRVVDVKGERVFVIGEETAGGIPASIPVGRIQISCDGPNDGTRTRVALRVASALPFRVNHLSVRVLVRREGAGRPWCHGARLLRLVNMGRMWECWLGLDLPDKGARRAVVGIGPEPSVPTVDVRFDLPARIRLRPITLEDGVTYMSADRWEGVVYVRNRGERAATVAPLIRLDGEALAYRVVEENSPYARAYELRLAPGQSLTLQPDLSAVRVAPGRRELQVYLKGPAAQVPACWPLDVTLAD